MLNHIKLITVAFVALVLAACALDADESTIDDDQEIGLGEIDLATAVPAVDETDPETAARCPNIGCNCGLTTQGSAPQWYWKNCTGAKRKVRVDVILGRDFTTRCLSNGQRIYLSQCMAAGPITTGCVRKITVQRC